MNLLRLKVVLAAVDADESSFAGLRAAAALAAAADAPLHVVHVAAPPAVTDVPPQAERAPAAAVESLLDRAGVDASRAQMHVIAGDPAFVIRTLADRLRADVIVLGPHRDGGSAGRRELGSTALAVATTSWAPCLIVSTELRIPFERVVVPVDLSDTAHGALMVALSWASALRGGSASAQPTASTPAALTALYVDRSPQSGTGDARRVQPLDTELDKVRAEAGTWAGVEITGQVVAGNDTASAIADFTRQHRADLVVLGTRGLGLDAVGRLGSVSAAVAQQVETPVLLVPPAVWGEREKRVEL
jgi:nucleotide-binding universal stress UspA family protein